MPLPMVSKLDVLWLKKKKKIIKKILYIEAVSTRFSSGFSLYYEVEG